MIHLRLSYFLGCANLVSLADSSTHTCQGTITTDLDITPIEANQDVQKTPPNILRQVRDKMRELEGNSVNGLIELPTGGQVMIYS